MGSIDASADDGPHAPEVADDDTGIIDILSTRFGCKLEASRFGCKLSLWELARRRELGSELPIQSLPSSVTVAPSPL
jgi:hypothetical protein